MSNECRTDGMSIFEAFAEARIRLWRAQERFQCFPAVNVNLIARADRADVDSSSVMPFSMRNLAAKAVRGDPYLGCILSEADLWRILRRELHWNNAELGFRIMFDRQPNVYCPDTHNLLCFLHL